MLFRKSLEGTILINMKIHLPMANFWLEADGVRIPFRVINVTDQANRHIKQATGHSYQVERSYVLVPILPNKFDYAELQLQSDLAFPEVNFDDSISSEFYSGCSWFVGSYVLGTAGYVNNDDLDEHISGGNLAGYLDVDERFKDQLLFQVSYKDATTYRADHAKYQWFDLSLDFSFDEMWHYLHSSFG